MDNTDSRPFINNNNLPTEDNQVTITPYSEEKPSIQNLNAPNPLSNPQRLNKPPYNTNNQQNTYHNSSDFQNNNTYPFDQNMSNKGFRNNPYVVVPQNNEGGETFPQQKEPVIYEPSKCMKMMLLVISIIFFIFLIVEISVLCSYGFYGNVFYIIDDLFNLTCAILFLISYISTLSTNLEKKCRINPRVRTIITVIVWFVGSFIRLTGTLIVIPTKIHWTFYGIKTGIAFFAIPISFYNRSQVS